MARSIEDRTSSIVSASSEEWSDAATRSSKLGDSEAAMVQAVREVSRQETWRVSMERRRGEKLGMRVDPTLGGSVLVIANIAEDGQIFEWNDAHMAEHFRCGDLILEVNGVSGDADAMQHVLRTSGPILDMRVSRYHDFPVHIDLTAVEADCSVGIVVDSHFVVQRLKLGAPAATQIQSLPLELQLRPGDRIVAVNNRRDPSAMKKLLKASKSTAPHVELQVQRPRHGELPSVVAVPRRRAAAASKDANEAAGYSFMESFQLYMNSGYTAVPATAEECRGLISA
mmetsp:Transcript_56289/g.134155  ORF Transcript_56289/g.134155 Transcript_56289/m.134155 type:complete len:284 (-) Transcript_56289:410-1261(-)